MHQVMLELMHPLALSVVARPFSVGLSHFYSARSVPADERHILELQRATGEYGLRSHDSTVSWLTASEDTIK